VGDAQQLPYPEASFAAALSLLVFNFIPDPKKALFELRRVTKAGGRISAVVWDYGDGMRMLRTFWDAAGYIDSAAANYDEKRMPLRRAGELSALWRGADLENIREQSIDISMKFESFADYWDPFLLGQWPAGSYVRLLDHEELQALRAEVKRRLQLSAGNASFVLTARVWAVRGNVPNARWSCQPSPSLAPCSPWRT
jgi:SAM-dependent methyltransferase